VAAHIRGLASMATKRLLADLSDALRHHRSLSVHFETAGGVQVASDIRAGAQADLVVLSAEVMSDLDADGFLRVGTLRPLFVSDVVAAAPDDVASVPLSTEQDLRAALIGAGRIAYSTGPSGKAFVDLIERWELLNAVQHKLLQAAPGTPVGSLLADGEADLGFQQRSEFAAVAGIRVLGPLPGAAAVRSTFSGAVLARSTKPEPAGEVLRFLESGEAEKFIRAAGMVSTRLRP
jgi:molybdate transport system substrate-binding protein